MRADNNEERSRVIKETLLGYVACASTSNSPAERAAEKYFVEYFGKQDYFAANKEYFGAYPIKDDAFDRAVVYAMAKGNGAETVVMIHHYDVVTVEDYKSIKDFAYSPQELEEKLQNVKDGFGEEAKADLESGKWLFGRGVCDMKGGGAVQMTLVSEYGKRAAENKLSGNVIVIGVPDEENLSTGMRAAVLLLKELKDKYGLEYKLMINSEPHQRRDEDTGVFSLGTIGKMMPYAYVRGYLAHAGKVFEGLNPVNVMSEIVRNTEVNFSFSDVKAGEAAPPPTWLYLRDGKESYDVSMPISVKGCLSVLTLDRSPKDVMEDFRNVCETSFKKVIDDMNRNFEKFAEATGKEERRLPWESKVSDFGQLCSEAKEWYGEEFDRKYADKIKALGDEIKSGVKTLIEANFELVDFVYDFIHDLSPRVVIGMIPPYYPNVSCAVTGNKEEMDKFSTMLEEFVKKEFRQEYSKEYFYTGICDLSYCGVIKREETEESLKRSMPFFGNIYGLPLKEMEETSMPCINIGPWGKDFHKLTERVYKEDLYERTPAILNFAVMSVLENGALS